MSEAEISSQADRRRFRRYPKYKDSGVDWLGEIPIAWNLLRLKRFVQFVGGGTPSKDNLEYWQGDIPWVSPKDMKSRIISDTIDKITKEAVAESATKVIGPGAVLIVVRSGILIHSIPVALSGTAVALNQDLKALIVDKSAVPGYLAYFFIGMQSMLLFAWRKEGATVESLELELIANTVMPLPAIEQQRIIVGFLDRETAKIDALIEKKERLIELLQEKRTALITQAVTKGLDPNVPIKDSGVEWLGKIPTHWNVHRLKLLASINDEALSEKTDPQFEMIYVDIGGVDKIQGILEREEYLFESAPSRARRIVRDGDVIISTVRTYLRAITPIRAPEYNLIVSTGFAVVRPTSRLNSDYAAYALRATYFVENIVANSTGVSYPAIEASKVSSFSIAFPELIEQQRIAALLDRETAKIDALVAKIQKAVEHLNEYRTALISAAVIGKIDIQKA